ncbi:Gfo/Idh/MocA family oxidoreductase [Sphingobacterium daejeonense]|uniref:Gfo/Idh/MocA family protein n=1 Tax=Sphingobacterium daejeonense TaxID=371142 RepID=UPI0021A66462|nr:Gfo/Idh/MocA family oxidoreductase [Sphingobacterium daejeonense]MCT1530488.1 Gfo/Idh/MocA family oxidoreductase [Sphingobacterium daejeonense]
MENRKLRMGMIGGGQGSFIGAVHRSAALLDGKIDLVCGAFSSRPDVAIDSGKDLALPSDRVYSSFQEMIERERELPEDIRMDFVSIVTPNNVHFEPAVLALKNGFHVVIDKPVTFTLQEAEELAKVVEETGMMLCLTHTYVGYPMVKQAKELVDQNKIGKIRKIMVEYPQGWLSKGIENTGSVQAAWRTDPQRSGKSGCMADIGTHAAHLAEHVSGLKITHLCANLNIYGEGRLLDDDGDVLLKFEDGATGVLSASQVATGEENALKLRIYGEKAGLEWRQEEPNTLLVKWVDQPIQIYRTGGNQGYPLAKYTSAFTRTPTGHPEGYLEAFANIYQSFAVRLLKEINGDNQEVDFPEYPGIEEGIRGMKFIDKIIESNDSDEKWTRF